MNSIGIMQGRLSPPVDGRIQAFPKETWKNEFALAAQCGLETIEWIFEADAWEANPVLTDPDEILRLSKVYGVAVLSLCADYFMDLPLLRASRAEKDARLAVFKTLIQSAKRIGVRYITVPFVDHSEITTDEERKEVLGEIRKVLPLAEQYDIKLVLETSLNPALFAALLREANHPFLKVNYDIGNSAALGYDTTEEIAAYGTSILTVHVKDRIKGGGTVPLGTGDADFDATFSALSKVDYQGPLILQAARGEDEAGVIRAYVAFVKRYLEKYF